MRSIINVQNGVQLEPYVPPPPPVVEATVVEEPKEKTVADEAEYKQNALYATGATSTALALASGVPNAPMMTISLACLYGLAIVVSRVSHMPCTSAYGYDQRYLRHGQRLAVCSKWAGFMPGTVPQ